MLSNSFSRIKSVRYKGSASEVAELLEALEGPLTGVESLALEIDFSAALSIDWCRDQHREDELLTWNSATSPNPVLSNLTLTGFSPRPHPNIYRHVRHLKLSNPDSAFYCSLSHFLDVLRALVIVETMEISRNQADWTSFQLPTFTLSRFQRFDPSVVTLNHLALFRYSDTASNISQLLTYIYIPVEAKLFITIETTENDLTRFIHKLLPSDRQRFPHLSHMQSLTFSPAGEDAVEIYGGNLHLTFKPQGNTNYKWSFLSMAACLFAELCQKIPPESSSTDLKVVTCFHPIARWRWFDILDALPSLKKLSISRTPKYQVREDGPLFSSVLLHKEAGRGGILCPRLDTLELENPNLRSEEEVSTFLELLKVRELKELVFWSPISLNCKTYETISKLVKRFQCNDWDGCRCRDW